MIFIYIFSDRGEAGSYFSFSIFQEMEKGKDGNERDLLRTSRSIRDEGD